MPGGPTNLRGTGGDAPAAPASLNLGAAAVSSVAVARIGRSADKVFEVYTIPKSNVIYPVFGHLSVRDAAIYAYSDDSNGVLADPSAVIYFGAVSKFLTESRDTAEIPYLIPETGNGQPQSALTFIRGAKDDRILIVYRPA